MKKYVILTIFLIILSGCSKSQSDTSITDVDVRKGFDGLVMEFTKNAPPERVFEESVFPVGINLKNKGADDIEHGEGFLALGFEKAYIDVIADTESIKFDIKGKSIFNLNGDEKFITLNAETKKVGAQSETHPSTILATACYKYQTILGTSVCVDPDIFGVQLRDKSCQVEDLEFNNGQGAPVAVTKIETRMLPHADSDKVTPHFMIHIENKGNGEVIVSDKIEQACSKKRLDYKDFNRMNIIAELSNQELDCSIGENVDFPEVRLRDKKDVVRCTLEEGIETNSDAFKAPLRIELDYGYTFTISKDLTIEKILKY